MKSFSILTAAVFGLALGLAAVGTTAATPKAEPQTIQVKAIEVVDENGKVTAVLGHLNGTTGLWVGNDKCVAIVQEKNLPSPYLAFTDTRSTGYKTNNGSNLALMLDDGKPVVQLVGPKDGDVTFFEMASLKRMAEKK